MHNSFAYDIESLMNSVINCMEKRREYRYKNKACLYPY